VRAERLAALQEQLEQRAQTWLVQRGGGHPVEPEALLPLAAIDPGFYRQQQRLAPFGIGNPQPIYWSRGCRVVSQKLLRGGHLQLELEQGGQQLRAMGWRWSGGERRLPQRVDVAFQLQLNRWQGREQLQLDLVGLRPSGEGSDGEEAEVLLQWRQRQYWCRRQGDGLVIRNAAGDELHSSSAPEHPYLRALLQHAAVALGLAA
jgi:single-stranded-DNA-specific exonuclease